MDLRGVLCNALCSGKLEYLLSPALVAEYTAAVVFEFTANMFPLINNNIIFPSLILLTYLHPSVPFFLMSEKSKVGCISTYIWFSTSFRDYAGAFVYIN